MLIFNKEHSISITDLIDRILHKKQVNENFLDESTKFITSKAEISGRLFKTYDRDGIKTSTELCSPDYLYYAAKILTEYTPKNNENASHSLKRINAAYKLLERARPSDHGRDALHNELTYKVENIVASLGNGTNSNQPKEKRTTNSKLATLPITVLFWEGPIARAYLTTLRFCGYRPRRIINLISSVDLSSGKPIGRFMPDFVRRRYCKIIHKSRSHYWSQHIRKNQKHLFSNIKDAVIHALAFPNEIYEESYKDLPLSAYCDDIVDLLITNLKDPALIDALEEESGNILFTGGGIVPKSVLDVKEVQFLHIHPGMLPHIRGADCTLWSYLLKNQPSATLFYLAPGIDDGDVILGSYLPTTSIKLCSSIDDRTKYRAIYAFYDPWIRAAVLRKGLTETKGFTQITATPQNHIEGVNFHFMHSKLRSFAFAKIFE